MKSYTEKYWSDQLTRSRNAHIEFNKQAEDSISVYDRRQAVDRDVVRQIGLWWYTIDTLLPVYCSRIPRVEVQLRKRVGSSLDQIASQGLERAVQYGLESYFDFLEVVQGLAKDFLLTGRAVSWVRYEPKLSEKTFEFAVTLDPETGVFVDPQGNQIDPNSVEIVEQKKKRIIVRQRVPSKDDEKFIIDRVHWTDYLVSPARSAHEIEWQARRAFLSKEEVSKMFGSKIASQADYGVFPTDQSLKLGAEDRPDYEGKSEWQEIWCKETGKVYWLSERGKERIIESGEPPLEFDDFFPCDVLCANESPRTVVPTSDWAQVKDMVIEVERLTTRIAGLIQSIRVTGAYDATFGDDLNAILSGDFKLVPVKKWPNYKSQRGGMANMIEMLDVTPYVNALTTAIQSRDELLGRYYEAVKIADIMRGAADAQETATAQRLKTGWASFGLKVRQNSFAEFVSSAITKCAKIVTQQFSDDHIARMSNAEDLFKQAAQAGLQLQSFTDISEAMRAGLDDYRISAASDSFVEINDAEERDFRKQLMEGTGAFLGQIQPMLEQYPQLLPYAMELMRYVNRSYKVGKEIEATLDGTLQTMTALIEQQQQQASQNPQPQDPATVVAQMQLQMEQVKAQVEMERINLDREKATAEIQLKAQAQQVATEQKMAEMILETEKMKMQHQNMQAQLALKQAEIALKAQDLAAKTEQSEEDSANKAAIESVYAMLEKEKNDIEKARLQLEQANTLLNKQKLTVQAAAELANIGVKQDGNRGSVPVLQGSGQSGAQGSGYPRGEA